MEDLGERVGESLTRAVGSDLPSGTAPPADSPNPRSLYTVALESPLPSCFGRGQQVVKEPTSRLSS